MVVDILPDTRSTGRVVVRLGGMNWIKVFCANCGKEHGLVPEENRNFACFLCDPCADKWGPQYGYAVMPDEVFWETLKQEQLDKFGRLLTPQELDSYTRASCNPLSMLIREHQP